MIPTMQKMLTEVTKEKLNETGKGLGDKIPDFSKENKLEMSSSEKIPNFSDSNKEYSYLPKSDGEWDGDRGNSVWMPENDKTPAFPGDKAFGEILDKHNIQGIEFKEGEADFSNVAEGNVEIDDFTSERNENFTQADEKLAAEWSEDQKNDKDWSPKDVKEYRKEHDLTWHERSDMKTLDLVARELHGNIPHSGGISEIKKILNGD